jgi:hypothetical protein
MLCTGTGLCKDDKALHVGVTIRDLCKVFREKTSLLHVTLYDKVIEKPGSHTDWIIRYHILKLWLVSLVPADECTYNTLNKSLSAPSRSLPTYQTIFFTP